MPEQADEVEARLATWLRPDPHHDAGSAYRVTTLYCDTPEWDVFHQQGRYRLFKLRLRRYGAGEHVYLERKAKRRDEVRKLRSSVAMEQLAEFSEAELGLAGYGGWYRRQLRRNRLRPVCLVEYERTAYYNSGESGPVRLTFDREIQGGLVDDWSFQMPGRTERVLRDRVVCEFKFRGVLPAAFKAVVEAMKLEPGRASKYRLCVQALRVIENHQAVAEQLEANHTNLRNGHAISEDANA
jgi:hypothetical protein